MQTECTSERVLFQDLGRREVVADFDGGAITSDAGGLLLRSLNHHRRFIDRFAECFTDYRDPGRTDHSLLDLLKQRIIAIALGYEDLNDHDRLRYDPLLAVLVDKNEPTGKDRRCVKDRQTPLAGKSTLNRLELTPADADQNSRYKKIVYHQDKIEHYFVDMFLASYKKAPEKIVLDLDNTDDIIHGNQEGRFFHGYYDHYCYLPLYIFCGDHLLASVLRTADQDGAAGCVDHLKRITEQIRKRWPKVRIIIRGDSGFCRDELMSWCEVQKDVFYILGMARNARLQDIIRKAMNKAKKKSALTGQTSRVFKTFSYRTKKSWSKKRKMVGKAEYMKKSVGIRRHENARFIVTNLPCEEGQGQYLYENIYCARGEMENRIKEQQLGLFADRTSTETMHANQLRLWFSSVAYLLISELRRVGLNRTKMAKAQVGTIRTQLFKIGALVKISVRRILISMNSACPAAKLFHHVAAKIQRHYLLV